VSQTPKRGRTVGAGIAMRALLRAAAREARERLARPASSARGYAVARERTAITSKLWQDRLAQAKAAGVSEAAATRAQEALVPKPPTRTSIRYSFSADENLLEAYRNPWNAVRVGRVLEDLDSLAGNIAFSHCDDADRATRPQLLVTASVDRVRLMRALKLEEDVILSGAVAWVGRSSMVIRMEAWPADHPDAPQSEETNVLRETTIVGKEGYAPGSGPSLSADFTFVARDAVTNKSAAVNPLVPDCDATQTLFAQHGGARRAQKRKSQSRKDGKKNRRRRPVLSKRAPPGNVFSFREGCLRGRGVKRDARGHDVSRARVYRRHLELRDEDGEHLRRATAAAEPERTHLRRVPVAPRV
jgi:acyl-CoA hydrolase